jgi:hypothetical protein
MFHGTNPSNTDDICTGNFNLDISTRFAFGRGIYFSKCPNIGLSYGKDLILCRVAAWMVTAKSIQWSELLPKGKTYRLANAD